MIVAAVIPVSTHAPARGRPCGLCWMVSRTLFQLTPPRGGDRGEKSRRWPRQRFQLTPPRGGDVKDRRGKAVMAWFQLTPPRGGDKVLSDLRRRDIPFQLTPPRGGDTFSQNFEKNFKGVSTHAPARGRRRICGPRSALIPGFNSRPREGATPRSEPCPSTSSRFNSRPREGATILDTDPSRRSRVSTHAPARGRPGQT